MFGSRGGVVVRAKPRPACVNHAFYNRKNIFGSRGGVVVCAKPRPACANQTFLEKKLHVWVKGWGSCVREATTRTCKSYVLHGITACLCQGGGNGVCETTLSESTVM